MFSVYLLSHAGRSSSVHFPWRLVGCPPGCEEEINRNYTLATDNYLMKPIDLTIDLFKVRQRIYYIDDPVYMEWIKYTTKDVQIQIVPGDHETFLMPPNDKEFARLLQTRLDQRML